MEDKFTWVGFYTEFANKLLQYKDDRMKLIDKIKEVTKKLQSNNIGVKFKLLDDGTQKGFNDIDPFTVFSWINSYDKNRKYLIREIKKEFNVEANMPAEFSGVPSSSGSSCRFFGFPNIDKKAKETDIPNLWEMFQIALSLVEEYNENNRDKFCKLYDTVIDQFCVGSTYLTMGLFWICPWHFISLDKKNREAISGYQKRNQLSDSFKLTKTKKINATEYLTILDEVNKLIKSGNTVSKSLVEFSANAFDGKIPEPTPNPKPTNKFPRNLILHGVPGTGKTYSTVNYALSIIENKELASLKKEKRSTLMDRYRQYVDKKRICFTTFHQSYGYEDFIGGLKPVEDLNRPLGFVLKWQDGVFKLVADEAKKHLDDNYVIIIDEINRGQISKIFGELITLIEEDKRKDAENEMSLKLASGYEFSVPKNLYILGTMNTADKSISLIDAALRRRFEFEEIYPDASLIEDETLSEIFKKLNDKLQSEFKSTDFLIGHAYFIGRTTDDLAVIMNNKIIPLLYEYYFDKEEKVRELLKEVLGNTDFEIDERNFGRLRIRQKRSI